MSKITTNNIKSASDRVRECSCILIANSQAFTVYFTSNPYIKFSLHKYENDDQVILCPPSKFRYDSMGSNIWPV